ncbi:MAG: glycosyltransferase family 2 protein [Lachnospiraceae bacterium]|jgi:glycosyltransferase involved in cell wall biosynthesis|nr:glycosyltransferase family 2 protein [Lachnospiraceae bacterium]MCH4028415.1 glycosyltransferase family 2 protein [Lachnospiraceae bacterium]MCH4066264.1 glycosyltransferase family 2 protein [Lachnospiraceae bacterium]MCH4112295.1 glycosyltransferase family 2 protein [Lachnospiraceae bacterium]MCI1391468.1 glycosyltransferase family 2 protein [Lachnospiraceae bacterium]
MESEENQISMAAEKTVLFLVVPCYNEEEVIVSSAEELEKKLSGLEKEGRISGRSRIVLVNDGSKDKTPKLIHGLHETKENIVCINFSRNFGHQSAVLAGYLYAMDKCDAVISIDADLQQDIGAIDRFLDEYDKGADIVYGVRNSRDTDGFGKKVTSQMFYGLMRKLGCEIIPNHADYRLLSNRVLHALSEYKEHNLFLRGLIPTLGFPSAIVHFDVHERKAGKSKYTLGKMLRLASDGITSFSIKPMTIIFNVGLIAVAASLINIIYTLVMFFSGHTVSGWSTIVISIWLFGGLQLIATGIIGEYIGKNYIESKRRPRYIIESIEAGDNDRESAAERRP